MKALFLAALAGVSFAQLNKLYKIDPSKVNLQAVTTPLVENTAFGACSCDRTLNSCDAYCCCDQDCSSPILDFWKSNFDAYCAKSYSGREYKPFSQCMDSKHIYNYNKRMGMQVSEQNGQLCVEMDTGSMFSKYEGYIDGLSQEQIDRLEIKHDLAKIIHQSTPRRSINGNSNAFKKGEGIAIRQNGQIKNFPLPGKGVDGQCVNSNGASFLIPQESSECSQQVSNLETSCSQQLNAAVQVNGYQFYRGSLPSGSSLGSIQIQNVYLFDSDNNQLTSASLQASQYIGVSCQCNNALKEVQYTVQYSRGVSGLYAIERITADVVLYKSIQLNSTYCSGTSQKHASVLQSYSINYKVTDDGNAYYRSGNPGYLVGYPVLVAENAEGVKQVDANGFKLFSGDRSGFCFTTLDNTDKVDFTLSTLQFANNFRMSCSLALTQAQLKEYCTSGAATNLAVNKNNLQIFSQIIERLKMIGVFGNAAINYDGDWIDVLQENLDGISAPSTNNSAWDEDTHTCTHVAGIEISIIHSKLGYLEKPQTYIVSAKKTGIYETWKYSTDSTTNIANQKLFNHFVKVNFVEVLPDELQNDMTTTSGLFPKLPADLFYPLAIQSDSSSATNLLFSLVSLGLALALLF
ncbi:hypothetical protein FGO68_gene9424 [Halteria grandinella]|uniref:Tectonic-1-3 N-terminal domain-containing protein n=1 Tax=Halteria grandinella TaxID=5974 RepID=A0A8J8T482_HALGN|nr:hypothetical protein FGO68_gene9424 [Halteria grandinella]